MAEHLPFSYSDLVQSPDFPADLKAGTRIKTRYLKEFGPQLLDAAATEAGLDPALVRSLKNIESGTSWNPTITSKAGAVGPMQLMGPAAQEMGVDRFNPDQNIKGGVGYLRKKLDKFDGNLPEGIGAYNAGDEAVRKAKRAAAISGNDWTTHLPTETQKYIPNVLAGLMGTQTGMPTPPAVPSAPPFSLADLTNSADFRTLTPQAQTQVRQRYLSEFPDAMPFSLDDLTSSPDFQALAPEAKDAVQQRYLAEFPPMAAGPLSSFSEQLGAKPAPLEPFSLSPYIAGETPAGPFDLKMRIGQGEPPAAPPGSRTIPTAEVVKKTPTTKAGPIGDLLAPPSYTPLPTVEEVKQGPAMIGPPEPMGPPAPMSLWEGIKNANVASMVEGMPQFSPLVRTAKNIASGAVGSTGALLSAEPWVEQMVGMDTSVGKLSTETAKQLDEYAQSLQPDDPHFGDKIGSALGSTLMFFGPGISIAKATAAIAKASPRIAAWSGAGAAALMEAGAEAGGMYQTLLKRGIAPAEAASRANGVFWKNVGLLAVTNKAGGLFDAGGSALRKMATGATMEGTQGLGQYAIGQQGLQQPMSAKDALEAAAIEAIVGGGIGGVLGKAGQQQPTAQPAETPTPETQTPEAPPSPGPQPDIVPEYQVLDPNAPQLTYQPAPPAIPTGPTITPDGNEFIVRSADGGTTARFDDQAKAEAFAQQLQQEATVEEAPLVAPPPIPPPPAAPGPEFTLGETTPTPDETFALGTETKPPPDETFTLEGETKPPQEPTDIIAAKEEQAPTIATKEAPIVSKAPGITPADIHTLADQAQIPWDDDPQFAAFTKQLTNKEHLDDMTPAELGTVRDAIQAGQRPEPSPSPPAESKAPEAKTAPPADAQSYDEIQQQIDDRIDALVAQGKSVLEASEDPAVEALYEKRHAVGQQEFEQSYQEILGALKPVGLKEKDTTGILKDIYILDPTGAPGFGQSMAAGNTQRIVGERKKTLDKIFDYLYHRPDEKGITPAERVIYGSSTPALTKEIAAQSRATEQAVYEYFYGPEVSAQAESPPSPPASVKALPAPPVTTPPATSPAKPVTAKAPVPTPPKIPAPPSPILANLEKVAAGNSQLTPASRSMMRKTLGAGATGMGDRKLATSYLAKIKEGEVTTPPEIPQPVQTEEKPNASHEIAKSETLPSQPRTEDRQTLGKGDKTRSETSRKSEIQAEGEVAPPPPILKGQERGTAAVPPDISPRSVETAPPQILPALGRGGEPERNVTAGGQAGTGIGEPANRPGEEPGRGMGAGEEEARTVRPQGRATLTQTLSEYRLSIAIREMGGIQPPRNLTGETRSLISQKEGSKLPPGVFRQDGNAHDDPAFLSQLEQAGFDVRSTDDLWAALGKESRGEPVYSTTGQKAADAREAQVQRKSEERYQVDRDTMLAYARTQDLTNIHQVVEQALEENNRDVLDAIDNVGGEFLDADLNPLPFPQEPAPRVEKTEAGSQYMMPGTPGRQMPTTKIQSTVPQRGTAGLPLFEQERVKHEMQQEKAQGSLLPETSRTVKEEAAAYDTPLATPPNIAPIFYSSLRRAFANSKQEKLAPQQALALLKSPGVKQEEVAWSGIEDFIKQQAKSVTKQDLLDFLDHNEVKVEEVIKGKQAKKWTRAWIEQQSIDEDLDQEFWGDFTAVYPPKNWDDAFEVLREAVSPRVWQWIGEHGVDIAPNFTGGDIAIGRGEDGYFPNLPRPIRNDLTDEEEEALEDFGDAVTQGVQAEVQAIVAEQPQAAMRSTKYEQYILPGAKEGSYRELLLTLPPQPTYPDEVLTPALRDAQRRDDWGTFWNEFAKLKPDQQAAIERAAIASESRQFRSSHFDEPNILAHVRFNERTDGEGKKVLFVEEIQSDWHQAGRKKGYAGAFEKSLTPEEKELRDLNAITWNGEEWTPAQEQRARELQAKVGVSLQEKANRHGGGVPNAPFKTSWQELAAKRMLRYAAENGYDKLAWATGEQQAERYDLSKQVDFVNYEKLPDGTYNIKAGKFDQGTALVDKTVAEKDIPGLVGKELADKMINGEGEPWAASRPQRKVFKGLDLKVGGEGMKGFYDSILPSFLSKYAKKWGAKVGTTDIDIQGSPETKTGLSQRREYQGPSLTVAEVSRAISSAPNATIQMQLRDMARVMKEGLSFAEAIRQEGSILTARHLGGDLVPLAHVWTAVHSLPITPAMKQSVLTEGQSLFERNTPHVEPRNRAEAIQQGQDVITDLRQPSRGVSALKGSLPRSRSGVRTLAQGIADQLTSEGRIDLRGQKVNSAEDLATLARVFRDKRLETFRIFYVQRGKIVAHEGLTSRRPSEVAVFLLGKMPHDIAAIRNRIARLQHQHSQDGAISYYLLHNHPGGTPTPSREDVGLTKVIANRVPGFAGHVVINFTEYGVIDIAGEADVLPLPQEVIDAEGVDPLAVSAVPHTLLLEKLMSQEALARIGKALQTPGQFVTLLYRSAQGDVRAIQEMPVALFRRTGEASNFIRGRVREFGSPQVFAYYGGKLGLHSAGETLIRNGTLFDVVIGEGEGLRDPLQDVVAEPKMSYGRSTVPQYRVAEETPAEAASDTPAQEDLLTNQRGGIARDILTAPVTIPRGVLRGINRVGKTYAGTRRQELQAEVGDTARGSQAYDEMVWAQYRTEARQAKNIETMGQLLTNDGAWRVLERVMGPERAGYYARFFRSFEVIGRTMGIPASRQPVLFDTAESIKEFDDQGNPVFGTKIFERDPKTKQVLHDPVTGDPIFKEWRFTAQEGQDLWDQLSKKERFVVRYVVESSENLKLVFGVAGEIEGYMHHFFEHGFLDGVAQLFTRRAHLKRVKSSVRKSRSEAKGFIKDLERSWIKMANSLVWEDEQNKLVERLVPLLTEPIGAAGVKPDWVEIPKTAKTRRASYVGQVAGGRQMPLRLYNQMIATTEAVQETMWVATIARKLLRAMQGNLMLMPGTADQNLIGSGLQYASDVASAASMGLLTQDPRPFLYAVRAPLSAVLPGGWKAYPPSALGVHSSWTSQFHARKDPQFPNVVAATVNKGLDAVLAMESVALGATIGAVDTWIKRAVMIGFGDAMGVPRDRDAMKNYKQEYLAMRRAMGTIALDYSDVNSRLAAFREHALSPLVSPFSTYWFMAAKLMGHFFSALNPTAEMVVDPRFHVEKSPLGRVGVKPHHLERLSRLMVVGIILALFKQLFPDEEDKDRVGPWQRGMDRSLDRIGGVPVGKGEQGTTRYLMPGTQLWAAPLFTERALERWVMTGESPAREIIETMRSALPSGGPLLQGVAIGLNYLDDPDTLKAGPAAARMLKPFMPLGRIAEGRQRLKGGPELQSRTFAQELAEASIFPIPDEWIGTRKIVTDTQTGKPILRDPTLEQYKFWFGIRLKDISPYLYRSARGNMLDNVIDALDKAESIDQLRSAVTRLTRLDPAWGKRAEQALETNMLQLEKRDRSLIDALTQHQQEERVPAPPPIVSAPVTSPSVRLRPPPTIEARP